jgi:hypothetical protein
MYFHAVRAFIDFQLDQGRTWNGANETDIVDYLASIDTSDCSGASIASISSAICQTHAAIFGTDFGGDSRVSRCIRGGKNIAPASTRLKGSFALANVDEHLLSAYPSDLGSWPADAAHEQLIRDGAVAVLHRYTYGRIGELRSFDPRDVKLRNAHNKTLPNTPENRLAADSWEFTLYGTKNGIGARQASDPIKIMMPRAAVVGEHLHRALHPARWINELEHRYTQRVKYFKDNKKAKAEALLFGEGFFLDTKPNRSGSFAPIAAASYSSSIQKILQRSGVTACDGADARAYLQRGTCESLLIDTGFPVTAVCKQARHKRAVLFKSYYDPSDEDHVLNVFQLSTGTSTQLLPIRQSEALLCASKQQTITSAARQARQQHISSTSSTREPGRSSVRGAAN